MGLGNRIARRHATAASMQYTADETTEFKPNQAVMTVDGYPGTVTAVNEGSFPGNENYMVTLHGGMGGGTYSGDQLKPITQTGGVHTADQDYPELGSILVERPDPARIAKKEAVQEDDESKKEASLDIWTVVTAAVGDSEFGFHLCASWADVQAKAKRIRTEGGVKITAARDNVIAGTVKGDHDTYESVIQYIPGKKSIAAWDCGCKWAAHAWNRKKYFARKCSHATALQFEAQSRGMFGREVKEDHLASADIPPVVEIYKEALAEGNDSDSVAFAFRTAGLTMQSAVSSPFGEPVAQVPVIDGPTQPPNPEDNPGSMGWATKSDPPEWNQHGPIDNGLTSLSSLDDAMFEPPLQREGFLPLLLEALPALAEGAGAAEAGGAAAEVGAGEAGMGSKALDLAKQLPTPAHGGNPPAAPTGGPGSTPVPGHPLTFGGTLHDEPEAALPFTDGSDDLEPKDESFVSTGSVNHIVASFQATASAQKMMTSDEGDTDIARAARAHLAKTATANFSPTEKESLIHEGEDSGVRASNLASLDITGTHYEALEALEGDDEWMM